MGLVRAEHRHFTAVTEALQDVNVQPEAIAALIPFTEASPGLAFNVIKQLEDVFAQHNIDPSSLGDVKRRKRGRPPASAIIVSRQQVARFAHQMLQTLHKQRPAMPEADRLQLLYGAVDSIRASHPTAAAEGTTQESEATTRRRRLRQYEGRRQRCYRPSSGHLSRT